MKLHAITFGTAFVTLGEGDTVDGVFKKLRRYIGKTSDGDYILKGLIDVKDSSEAMRRMAVMVQNEVGGK